MKKNNVIRKIWNFLIAFVAGKRCKKCGQLKMQDNFYQHKGHKYRSRVCKTCVVEKNKFRCQIFLEKNSRYNKTMNKKHRQRKTELQQKYRAVGT
jgi:hypothetical protein